VIAGVDRTRVILETDAPYLAPVPHRGQRNEPAHVSLVAKELGTLWDMDIEEVAERTTQNALAFFEPELAQTTKNAYA
jgi:TatD DNase family protein